VCGIVAALPVYGGASDQAPDPVDLPALLPEPPGPAAAVAPDPAGAEKLIAGLLERTETALRVLQSQAAVATLCRDGSVRAAVAAAGTALSAWAGELDAKLDAATALGWSAETTEVVQLGLRQLSDRLYAVLHDRVEIAARARALAPGEPTRRSAVSYVAIETVLAAVDRLEVRGRDSAGITVWIRLDGADRAALAGRFADRADPEFRGGAAVLTTTGACFAYKHAAVVGKLGDNVAALRHAIQRDGELHEVLALPSAAVTVLSHTRWASVGRISEANAHPVDSRGRGADGEPFAVVTLNGDIDNYTALLERARYQPSESGISTDAKVIPALLGQRLAAGDDPGQAMGACLADFAGSMAIAAQPDTADRELLLAVKGSGQSLFVGLGPAGFVVASEVYGLVASTREYLRVGGAAAPGAGRAGTVIRLVAAGSGTLAGLRRLDGDGVARPVEPAEVRVAEVTTRDLALGSAQHYLQKEIYEAPSSFRKTLRGRIQDGPAGPIAVLPESSLPAAVRDRVRGGQIREVIAIGQGTAAVACQGIAQLIQSLVGDSLTVGAQPASEFSAWRLRRDMSDLCVVAVSQSGTTTDTNRSVDLARERGATIISIVNRRDSDLAMKSHGVLYTSDGRDVEMSVASTKAFYAQIAGGCLLGVELARELGALTPQREASLLEALRRIPDQLVALRATREGQLAAAAAAVATRYPYWAVVGSGPNRVAAAEIRIKLSELCYKSISTDAVEDKKHIDLSAEALVLVCVAGAPPGQVSDLVKEVEILTAHGNRPVVLCDENTEHMWPADIVIGLPPTIPDLMWILTTAAGHLFAYHAALSIDRAAEQPRAALAELERAVDHGLLPSAELPLEVLIPVAGVLEATVRGDLRGVLTSQAALNLAQLVLQPRHGGLGGGVFPEQAAEPVSLARALLTRAIDELGRPIDSVKHQAKTVTVGTSRDDVDLYENDIVDAMLAAGLDRNSLQLPVLRVIRAHSRLVEQVTGVTRYRVRGADAGPTIEVVQKTGVAAGLASRADQPTPLVGSKRRVADLRMPRLLRGRLDSRVVLVIPEQDAGEVSHLALVHVRLRDYCSADELVAAMNSVGDRMADIVAAVTETRPSFVADRLQAVPTEDVLLAPVEALAEQLAAG